MRDAIKLKLEVKKMQMLIAMYEAVIPVFVPENEHEHLLYEHVKMLYRKLCQKIQIDQERYTFAMTNVEALAFIQFWQIKPLALPMYAATIVNRLVGEIDKKVKQPKLYAAS